MLFSDSKSITLFELLVAVILVSLLVLGISSINTFSKYHVLNTEYRLKVQNDLSYILQHMMEKMNNAVGNFSQPAVVTDNPAGGMQVWLDTNQNGIRETNPIAYVLRNNEMRYYSAYTGIDSSYEVLSSKIYSFTPTIPDPRLDCVDIDITACYTPATGSPPNGTQDNPCIEMQSTIHLPGVSAK